MVGVPYAAPTVKVRKRERERGKGGEERGREISVAWQSGPRSSSVASTR